MSSSTVIQELNKERVSYDTYFKMLNKDKVRSDAQIIISTSFTFQRDNGQKHS